MRAVIVNKFGEAPPITRITLDQVPALLNGAESAPAGGKTVVTL